MKKYIKIVVLFLGVISLSSCEDVINLEDSIAVTSMLVVDGSVTNLSENQVIKLTKSQNYFNNSTIQPVLGASVTVTDDDGKVFEFKDLKGDGVYVWQPTAQVPVLGVVGKTYTLKINAEGETYQAVSPLKRVPVIDSIAYQFDEARANQRDDDAGKPKEGYDAQFYARDFDGIGDCYRIIAYKNGKALEMNNTVSIAYDAAIQKSSGAADGIVFTLPVRSSISPELYLEKDVIKVELRSITEGHYDFWSQARQEINNGGLFARPAANIPTNVVNTNANSTKKAAGWFGTSAVSISQTVVDAAKAQKGLR